MRSRVWLGALLTLLVAALVLLPAAAAAKNKPADTVFKNGYIYTVNPGARAAQAVAVMDGRIVYVGSNQGANAFVGAVDQGRQARRQDDAAGLHRLAHPLQLHRQDALLGGAQRHRRHARVVPQRTSARSRPPTRTPRRSGVPAGATPSLPTSGPWPGDHSTPSCPTSRPRSCPRTGTRTGVNTKALELAGIDGSTPDPAGGKIERLPGTVSAANPYGVPSGTLRESAADLVNSMLPDYSVGQYEAGHPLLPQSESRRARSASPRCSTRCSRWAATSSRPTRNSPRRACSRCVCAAPSRLDPSATTPSSTWLPGRRWRSARSTRRPWLPASTP